MAAGVAGRQAPGYCHFVNALGAGAGAPDGGAGRDLPDQARLGQLAEEQAALRRVATLVAHGVPPEEVFAAVAEEVGQLFRVELATLCRYEPGRMWTPVTTWGPAGENLPVGIRWPLEGHNVSTLVFESGRPARIDRYADSSSGPVSAVPREIGIRSAVGTPVIVEGRLWGVIFAGSTLEQPLPADTEARLASFTELVATAVANTDSRAELARLAEEQAALRRVATLVARATPPQEVFAAVAEEVGRLLAVDFAILVRYDPQDTLEVVGTWTRTGAPAPTPVGGRLPLGGRNVTTLVYRTGRPARIDYSDVSGVIGRVASRDWGLRSSVGVPVSAESRLWGCIVVAFSGQEPLPLPADTEARLASFTELVATAIANTESRASLARLAEEQAALRRVATLVAQGVPPVEIFSAVSDEVARPVQGAVGGPQVRRRGPGRRLRRRLEDPRPPGRDAMGVPDRNGFGGGLPHRMLRPCRRDGLAVGQRARRGSRPSPGCRLDGREPDRCRGPSVGRDDRRVRRRASAVRYGGTPGEVHRAGRHRDRECGEPVGAGRLAPADRRRVGRGSPADRARSARRYPAAAGLARAGGAHRGGRWCRPARGDLRAELSRIAAGLADAVAELQEFSRGIHPAILVRAWSGPGAADAGPPVRGTGRP